MFPGVTLQGTMTHALKMQLCCLLVWTEFSAYKLYKYMIVWYTLYSYGASDDNQTNVPS